MSSITPIRSISSSAEYVVAPPSMHPHNRIAPPVPAHVQNKVRRNLRYLFLSLFFYAGHFNVYLVYTTILICF